MKLKLIMLFILTMVVSSCSPSRTEISGDIFIRTESGETSKLGAVTVYLFTPEKIEELNKNQVFDLPPHEAVSQTETNFSGEFVFKRVPKGKYLVVANTSTFSWRVPIDTSAKTNLTLNNTNTLKHLL